MTQTWLITGDGRGMGVEFARAALAAGHNVAATGRNPDSVRSAVGAHEKLLVTSLDVTDPHSAESAAAAAIDRFGRIDVLLNNAGSFLAGFFEELTTEQVRSQIETNLFGPMTVTRAVLPIMRRQRSGLVISISSGAGIAGGPSGSAYAASKFALEGWMEALTGEVQPFGIRTMIVEPGFFRTELLTPRVDHVRRVVDRRLRPGTSRGQRVLGLDERHAGRRPGQTCRGARAAGRLAGAAAALGRRC